jgi:hypothetical protein
MYLDSVERYNPQTDAWETLTAKMPTARSGFGTAVVGRKIYTIGGYGNSTIPDVVLGNVEAYDTDTNTWEAKAGLLNPKADLGASDINGNIYAVGGVGFSPYTGSVEALSELEEYDVANNVWNKKTDMNASRKSFGISSVNSKMYIIGGIGTNSLETSAVEELTVVNGNASLPPVPTATPRNSYKVCGNIIPDFSFSTKVASILKADFKVEVAGTELSAVTDFNGYFEISNVPSGTYTLKISKENYLSRNISNVAVTSDVAVGFNTAPVYMWVGDIAVNGIQDGAINMADIMEMSRHFNSTPLNERYAENSDINKDSAVNMSDIMIIVRHFNKVSKDYPAVTAVPTTFPSPTSTVRPSIIITPTPTVPTTGPTVTPIPSTLPSTVPGGTLTFQVQTVSYNGGYAPRNVGAIWIQDSTGAFVKSLKVWARSQISRLTNWNTSSRGNRVDAVTSATINSHQLHTATWNCTDVNGAIVKDGTYRICVEFTESNATGKYAYFNFTKGSSEVHLTPANQANFTNIKLDFVPSLVTIPPSGTVSPTGITNPTPTPPGGGDDDDDDDDEEDDD